MHGRQHTGVSIYEARTETREKDERNGRSDGEVAIEMTDGEMRMRQWRKIEKERDTTKHTHTNERERKSKRNEDPCKEDAAERERENDKRE